MQRGSNGSSIIPSGYVDLRAQRVERTFLLTGVNQHDPRPEPRRDVALANGAVAVPYGRSRFHQRAEVNARTLRARMGRAQLGSS